MFEKSAPCWMEHKTVMLITAFQTYIFAANVTRINSAAVRSMKRIARRPVVTSDARCLVYAPNITTRSDRH